ncbi:hypothetical protein KAMAJI_00270 [Serratia phage vB_SmaM-Kamaji]|nr:hypothetical protein KAMAJI_00270 [Serratia phage vB_SmaM-Kamaji]
MLVILNRHSYGLPDIAVNPDHVTAVFPNGAESCFVELTSINEDGLHTTIQVDGSVTETVRKLNEGVYRITQHLYGDLSNVDQIRRKTAVHGTISGRS